MAIPSKKAIRLIKIIPLIIPFLLALPSCLSDNKEELFPELSICDTVNVSYSNDIAPVLQNRCYQCHSNSSNLSGILLDNYEGLSEYASNGKLLGAIKHEEGFLPMPADGGQLGECSIEKIEAWINQGGKNN